MTNILDEIIDIKKISKVTEVREEDIKAEIVNVFIEKESLTLNLDVKLNFVMPQKTDELIKYKLKETLGNIRDVNISYVYDELATSEKITVKLYMPYIERHIIYQDSYLAKFINIKDVDIENGEILIKVIGNRFTDMLNDTVSEKIESELRQKFGYKYKVKFVIASEDMKIISKKMHTGRIPEVNKLNKKVASFKEKNIVKVSESLKSKSSDILLGSKIKNEPVIIKRILDLDKSEEMKGAVTDGIVFKTESRPIKNKKCLVTVLITDKKNSICIKSFMAEDTAAVFIDTVKKGDTIRVQGTASYDKYDNEIAIMGKSINKIEGNTRQDKCEEGKRVELHAHTIMSDSDGFNDIGKLVEKAARWGQPAVAITDHGVVQAFPDAAKVAAELEKKGKNIKIIYGMEGYLYEDSDAYEKDGSINIKKHGTYHIIIIVKNQIGLKNLYKLVSFSHIDYFYKKPRIPRSILNKYREGLILGTACEAGELYKAVEKNESDEKLMEIADFYDYMEIQPRINNQFLIDEKHTATAEDLINHNKKILEIGDRLGKLTVATTDAHYDDPESAIYRNIIMHGMGFKDANANGLYLRTTDEMLEEFSYLGDRAKEVVITNTNKIADMADKIKPVPDGKYPPKIKGAEETLKKTCYANAHKLYGEVLPEAIEERLDTELSGIIGNGYAVMYVAAQLLVEKSLSDGYLVGSRGSVGSSFAATMAGITEVNPLDPHYICPKCKHFEFYGDLDKYDCGLDLPEKECPECGTVMKRDGFNIPFATFLGFSGNKEPDIDLNFAGEYQGIAHKYVGNIFGVKNIFKAGTVSTIADKTAYGYVMHYLEDTGRAYNKYDVDMLTQGCTGVKRTTGQHPGGIIIVPDDHEIYEFCPVQKPANKQSIDIITTHFDYHKIDKNLLKLDILGHDIPSMIRQLQDMTGINPLEIDMGDKKVMSIFTSIDALNIKNKDYKFKHGTYGIPEFGTAFVRQMLDDVQPKDISALIRISGFSHGTDVWLNNAQELIRKKTADIKEAISTRDDIMNYLILKGLDNDDAFMIMEHVRKNKVLADQELLLMDEHGVPEWYVESCKTLKYLFPRAHAVAYVMMSIRMAWFKVYYPNEFYATYLTTKIDHFNLEIVNKGIKGVEQEMEKIDMMGKNATKKIQDDLIVYEVVYELMSRGCEFGNPKLGLSQPCKFSVVDGKIQIPFMAVNGLGKTAALSFAEEYEKGAFKSVDEAKSRTKLSGSNIENLKIYGVFDGIPESAQVSIFEMAQMS